MLAKHMGLSIKEINEMPLYKVLLYYHAIIVSEGSNTRWEYSDKNEPKISLNALNKFIEEI